MVVPIGGGGLISGVALAVANLSSSPRVFGVEPHGACAMRQSLDKGEAVRLDDTVYAPRMGEMRPSRQIVVEKSLAAGDTFVRWHFRRHPHP